jgi:XRE family transcriptional regulator, regulator of sulfur utilization
MARSRKSAFGRLVGRSFGKLLRDYRSKARLSVQRLATEADVDRKYLYQLEKGTSQPTLEIVFRLTDALALDSSELVGRTQSLVMRASRRGRPSRRPVAPSPD